MSESLRCAADHAVIALCVVSLAVLSCNSTALSQDEARWQVPPSTIAIDFTKQDPAPRKTLTENGLVWEFPVAFAMLRQQVTVAVKVPEEGDVRFDMKTTDALVDIETKRVDTTKVNIVLRSQLGRMGVNALQQSVRKEIHELLAEPRKRAAGEVKKKTPAALRQYLGRIARGMEDQRLSSSYVDRRGIELGKGLLHNALEEVIAQRPRWATRPEQAAWLKADGKTLHQAYERLLGLRLADEHLRRCGIRLDTNTRNFGVLIVNKFKALHAFVSGGAAAAGTPASSAQDLSREEVAGLRRSLVIEGVCQFVPATNDSDANSQWFNAQRIGSSVSSVPEIRVVGSLAPAKGDRSDWWTLVGFEDSEVKFDFPNKTGFRHELYHDPTKRTCLRIIATGNRNTAYSFKITRKSNTSGKAIVVHESPGKNNAKFPY
jgi:hypothetical protein